MAEAVQWAEEHLFDRNSVVLECQIWQHALERARGQGFSIAELKEFTRLRNYIRHDERPGEVTLREVLLREWEIVQTAKEGIGACHSLVWNPRPANPRLDDEQRRALRRLARFNQCGDAVSRRRGHGQKFCPARTGRASPSIGQGRCRPRAATSAGGGHGKGGVSFAQDGASFLQRRELPEGALIVVDEAGQIGGRQMLELVRLAKERNARLVLSGDTRQHGAVEASDALLAIEQHSGVRPVELHKIRRQDPERGRDKSERAHINRYRKAVEVAAAGKLSESFERLDKMGAVVSCGLGEQADKLAGEYVRLAEQNASAVVVSQTWDEVRRVNSSVRDALKSKGLLGANDTAIQVLDKLDLTKAQKRDERFYPPDAVIVFNQKVREVEPGAKGKVGQHFQVGRAGRSQWSNGCGLEPACSTG